MTWNLWIFLLCVVAINQSIDSLRIGERKQFTFDSKYGSFQTAFQSIPPEGINENTLPTPRTAALSSLPVANNPNGDQVVPSVLFVHGFGGNADQFRKNLPYLASQGYPSYAIDLLGYGYSDKPNPKPYGVNELYNFYTWSDQIASFIEKEIRGPTVIVANSVGCVAALVAANQRPDLVKGLCLINISLRLLHKTKQNPFQRIVVPVIQSVFRETALGKWFFKQVATTKTLRTILSSAYALKDENLLNDEIVELILKPGLDPRAPDVFLDFISYSGGPLPEELIPKVQCPLTILWGEDDPWEPVHLATETFASLPTVKQFKRLPKGGHCCMDQIPNEVNEEILKFLQIEGAALR